MSAKNTMAMAAELRKKGIEMGKLLEELERSLALMVLWPGIWKLKVPVRSRFIQPPPDGVFEITAGDETRVFPVGEVPDSLVKYCAKRALSDSACRGVRELGAWRALLREREARAE